MMIQYPPQRSICKLSLLCCIAEMAAGHSRLESHLVPPLWKNGGELVNVALSGAGYRQICDERMTIIYGCFKCVSPVIHLHPTGCGIAREEEIKANIKYLQSSRGWQSQTRQHPGVLSLAQK